VYDDDDDFPFISKMVYDSLQNTIYAVTQTASFYQMGANSLLCYLPLLTGQTGVNPSTYKIYELDGLSDA
jgi:hypothetical protein